MRAGQPPVSNPRGSALHARPLARHYPNAAVRNWDDAFRGCWNAADAMDPTQGLIETNENNVVPEELQEEQ